jgi:hypothetical protein
MPWNRIALLIVAQASTLWACAACGEHGETTTQPGPGTGGHAGAAAASAPAGRAAGAAPNAVDAGSPSSGPAAVPGASGQGGGGDRPSDPSDPSDASNPSDPSDPRGPTDPSECGLCDDYTAPMQTGTVAPTELDALSGLAVSRKRPEILFAHNDHDRAVVYALDRTGVLRARIGLQDAMASDIEDIAIGPCEGESCIYLADIGDNAATRSEYALLRFTEPDVPSGPSVSDIQPPFERFGFQYEDGSHNAEALMVAPDGTVYVVTKLAPGSGGSVAATGPSSVYRLSPPFSSSTSAVAVKVATLPIPAGDDLAASAAAAHRCGLGFLVRTYNRVYEFRTPKDGGFEDAFAVVPVSVAMPAEPQSEGIDYLGDGRGFVSSGEGANAPIQMTACR